MNVRGTAKADAGTAESLTGMSTRRGADAALTSQIDANLNTADSWELYRDHRKRVTDVVASLAVAGGRLCVLGAGNCNDLDLARIATLFAETHLVDLDNGALERALARNESVAHGLVLHGGVDITGVLGQLSNEQWRAHSPEVLSAQVEEGTRPPNLPPAGFDVVLSATVFTQIVDTVMAALGQANPAAVDVVLAARTGHLRLMLDLLRPGGTAVFVTDLVASDTFPRLLELPEEVLADAMLSLVATRNFFTGTNPVAIVERLRRHPELSARASTSSLVYPWRWHVGPERQRLVYAMLITRR